MTIWKKRAQKKPSGGKYWPARKKKSRELGPDPILPTIGASVKTIQKRQRGGHKAIALRITNYANLLIAQGKYKKVKINTVKENPANRHFVRMNALTKGAIIDTEAGLAKVTSRPTRDGIVNAVLVKK